MKLDYYEIKCLEQENDAIWLYRLQKKQYLYLKVSKQYPEKIFYIPITLQNGKSYNVKFVKIADLEQIKREKYLKKSRQI